MGLSIGARCAASSMGSSNDVCMKVKKSPSDDIRDFCIPSETENISQVFELKDRIYSNTITCDTRTISPEEVEIFLLYKSQSDLGNLIPNLFGFTRSPNRGSSHSFSEDENED